jgi:hypothetical protein
MRFYKSATFSWGILWAGPKKIKVGISNRLVGRTERPK